MNDDETDLAEQVMALVYEYGSHRWLAGRGEGQELYGDMNRESALACKAANKIRRLLGLPAPTEQEESV